jgi:hypothetical protein
MVSYWISKSRLNTILIDIWIPSAVAISKLQATYELMQDPTNISIDCGDKIVLTNVRVLLEYIGWMELMLESELLQMEVRYPQIKRWDVDSARLLFSKNYEKDLQDQVHEVFTVLFQLKESMKNSTCDAPLSVEQVCHIEESEFAYIATKKEHIHEALKIIALEWQQDYEANLISSILEPIREELAKCCWKSENHKTELALLCSL